VPTSTTDPVLTNLFPPTTGLSGGVFTGTPGVSTPIV
jgi:hypothetical protein